MPFTQKTLNAFEMTGRMAACEIPAANLEYRAFIGVYAPSAEGDYWLVRRFEVPKRLVSEYFGEGDLQDNRYLRFDTIEEVEATLVSWPSILRDWMRRGKVTIRYSHKSLIASGKSAL